MAPTSIRTRQDRRAVRASFHSTSWPEAPKAPVGPKLRVPQGRSSRFFRRFLHLKDLAYRSRRLQRRTNCTDFCSRSWISNKNVRRLRRAVCVGLQHICTRSAGNTAVDTAVAHIFWGLLEGGRGFEVNFLTCLVYWV